MKKFLKWLAYCAAAFIIVISILAGITQTQFFRNTLRSFAQARLDSLLDADIHLGNIQGNLISGFSIDSVSIAVQGESVISMERLDIRYDLLEIPSRKINVSTLTLIHPRIQLLCGTDSIWNFSRMIRPAPDDTASGPFDWPIAVNRFEIKNGSVRLVDSASLAEFDHETTGPYFVEYHDFAADNLNMVLNSVLVATDVKRANIKSMSFTSTTPDVTVKQFSGEFRVTNREAVVKNMKIQTSRSQLTLDVSMKDIDLLGGIELSDLKAKPVELSLRTNKLDLAELRRFIHQLDFLDGELTSEIVATGQFGRLEVKQIHLNMRNTNLYFAGYVSNLHDPDGLLLDVKCRESVIDYNDVLALMPSLELPDYTSIGPASVEFDFNGEPLDFITNLTFESQAGALSTKGAKLRIGGPETLAYQAEIVTRGLQISHLLQDEKVNGELNSVLRIEGHGTSLDDLTGTIQLVTDSSRFAGKVIGPSEIFFTSANRKLEGNVNLAFGSMRTQLRGELDRSDVNVPEFRVEGKVSSLNLAELLNDDSQDSDLTMTLEAQGTGLRWESISGNSRIALSSSRYREYRIDSSYVSLAVDQRDPMNSSIKMTSDVADFSIYGKFDLDYMVGLTRYEIDNLRLAIGRRFSALDSTLVTSFDEAALTAKGDRLRSEQKELDAAYTLTVKTLEPVSILTGNRMFDATGTISGSLQGNFDDLQGEAEIAVEEFFYGNADSGMLVQNGIASLRVNDLKPVNPLSELTLRVRVDAGKMHINRTKLDTLKFGIFYDKEYAGFVVQADYDRDTRLRTSGQIGVTDEDVRFVLSNLFAGYRDFMWKADDGASVAVSSGGMRIQNVTFRRDSQNISLNGAIESEGRLNAVLRCNNLNLEQLRYVLPEKEQGNNKRQFEGLADLDANLKGTLSSPVYEAKLNARNVYYRGFPFGEIQGILDYKDQQLATTLLIDNRPDKTSGQPDLSVTGVLPINLALTDVDERLPARPMEFTVYSDGLQMSLLDPLLPTFNELKGTLKANFKVGGTPQRPNFTGSMSIEECSFLFMPNNMFYRLSGTFKPEGERIKILSATIRNVESDNRPGREGILTVTGDFALSELVPSDFNFDISGQLLVVNRNTRTSSLAVYGELPVEIAQRGLHFSGDVQNSLLRGQVLVRNSTLAFPPTASSAREDTFYIPLRVVDDTTKVVESEVAARAARYFTTGQRSGSGEQNGEARSRSFIDGLRYDLSVEFAGSNNEVRMIFNPTTNEELVANITGNAAITEDGKSWNGVMDVRRASYNFYGKRFDAEGTMTYTGDFLNPELNITATYQGSRKYSESSNEENVIVTYKILGTRFAPRPEISMTIDGVDYYAYKESPTSNDVQSDALTFVITNNFPLTRGERNNIAEQVGPTVGAGLLGGATSLLTSTLAEFLRNRTGFIHSFEFRYDRSGSFGQSADVRLGGTAFKGYWRYGGKILEDPFSNANFSILYSFGDIFDRPSLRNFMVELERKVDTMTLFGSVEARKEMTSARFFYRISF